MFFVKSIFNITFFFITSAIYSENSGRIQETGLWYLNDNESRLLISIPAVFPFSIEGSFDRFSLDKQSRKLSLKNIKSIKFSIDAGSLATNNPYRDAIITGMFLQVDTYPEIQMEIMEWIPVKNSEFTATYRIKLKGIEKTYTGPLKLEIQSRKVLLQGTLRIPRKDFSMKGNLFLEMLLHEEFQIDFRFLLEKK